MKAWQNILLKTLKPLIGFWAKLHWPYSIKKIKGKHYYKWRQDIKIGHILLTKTNGQFSNLINPTKIKHGAMYIGNYKGLPSVIEAVRGGVRLIDLVTFLTTKDYVAVVSPQFLTLKDQITIRDRFENYVGEAYDYFFDKRNKKQYCYELIASLLGEARPDIRLKCKRYLGKRIYFPETFLDDGLFKKIHEGGEL